MIKIIAALILINTSIASFEYTDTNPASLFPYYTAASDSLPLGNLSNPAYLPLYKTYYINADYGRPYWMEELDSGNIRIGRGFESFALQASWNRFGIDEYRENIFTGSMGYMPWKFLSVGVGVSHYRIDLDTYAASYSYGLTDFSASALVIPIKWLNLSYTYTNIYSAFKKERRDIAYPAWSAGLSVSPVKGISFIWNTNRHYYDYINTFCVSASLLPFLNMRAGYSRETSSYSAAVIIRYKHLMVSYGLSHHSYLGLTHKLGITLSGNASLSFEPVNYNKRLISETLPAGFKRIDINNCTFDELIDSEIFPEIICERIIKYRKLIGPVTEKALIQIGLTPAEVNSAGEKIKGLAKEGHENYPDNKEKNEGKKTRSKRFISIENRQILFKRLLEEGLSATEALRITNLARYKSHGELIAEIRKCDDIPDEKKNKIIKTCRDLL